MLNVINTFDKATKSNIQFEAIELACGNNINVYTIETVHDLTQFIGLGKYINNQSCSVYLRGQADLYEGKLEPSLYRGKRKYESITPNYYQRINKLRDPSVKKNYFKNYDKRILEPLLQHYGVKTTYIDLVDNVWIALWFALHQTKSVLINSHEYVYYSRNINPYSYILLVASDAINVSENSGVYEGETTSLVDLRKALPSYFLRPHAQHAYMLKKKAQGRELCDYSDLIVGIAKIPTELGFQWIGTSEFLSVGALFPAPYFDTGYGNLLEKYPEYDVGTIDEYGSIHIVSG